MTQRSILLLGANGQVGQELRHTLAALGPVIALARPDIDLANPESLRAVVRRHEPSIILNAAAYTAVDKAESEPDRAFAINATAPAVLAEEAETLGACLVHYSTDYVFDGSKSSPYVETDATGPLSVYGSSKLEGELAVRTCRKHLIFRTSWVVSAHGQNFIKTMLRLAGERDVLRVVADQFGAPTSAALLADITAKTLSQLAAAKAGDSRWGLYHTVAGGETSWHGLAKHVIARARQTGIALKAEPQSVMPITTAEYPTPAMRPKNSRLDTSKLRAAFNLTLPDWTDDVDAVLDQLLPATAT
ncbi:MAG: dTDP-4-dehydrorhamnose reductase [Rhizomicrobium sp.]